MLKIVALILLLLKLKREERSTRFVFVCKKEMEKILNLIDICHHSMSPKRQLEQKMPNPNFNRTNRFRSWQRSTSSFCRLATADVMWPSGLYGLNLWVLNLTCKNKPHMLPKKQGRLKVRNSDVGNWFMSANVNKDMNTRNRGILLEPNLTTGPPLTPPKAADYHSPSQRSSLQPCITPLWWVSAEQQAANNEPPVVPWLPFTDHVATLTQT